MPALSSSILEQLGHDSDAHDVLLRQIITDRLAVSHPAAPADAVIATYYLALRTLTLAEAAREISYHATSGARHPVPGSLVERCTGWCLGTDAFDAAGKVGLVYMAYPLAMLQQADGHLTTTDILHTAAGAIIFDVYENRDARLVEVQFPDAVLATFPGPAYGPHKLRHRMGFQSDEPAFGTILKPTAGITPDEVGALVEEAARSPLFLFVKEDENLYPRLPYSHVADRTRCATAAIERVRGERGGRGIIFAPHVTSAPHELLETVDAALEAGATGLMFSESFAGGAVRMVREATRSQPNPPAIYGHNAGIGVKTRGIWREVVDFLARLDGIDFRQTAPVRAGAPFIRPFGAEWIASEHALTRPIGGIEPVMIARAGGLDQGNIGLNLADAEDRGLSACILYLAGSAINSIKNGRGEYDPRLGAEAMHQALDVHTSGELRGISAAEHLKALFSVAQSRKLSALIEALRQRYPADAL